MSDGTLNKLREEINKIDERLLSLIAERIKVVQRVGEYKVKNNLPVKDTTREEELIRKLNKKGEELGISNGIVEEIWRKLFEISYRVEKIETDY